MWISGIHLLKIEHFYSMGIPASQGKIYCILYVSLVGGQQVCRQKGPSAKTGLFIRFCQQKSVVLFNEFLGVSNVFAACVVLEKRVECRDRLFVFADERIGLAEHVICFVELIEIGVLLQ